MVAMTEARGSAGRWSAAALTAPVAASLFAGTTVWALHHDPLHAQAPQAPRVVSVPAPDPTVAALQAAVLANARRLAALGQQVDAVRAQAAALASANGAVGRSSAGTAARGGSSTRSAPIVVRVPAAKPPPTSATTGASGAVK